MSLLLVVLISGCTAEDKAGFIIASNNLSQSVLDLHGEYAEGILKASKTIEEEDYSALFAEVCPVHEFKGPEVEFMFYLYYPYECDFSKTDLLKNSGDYSDKIKYLGLSYVKALSIIADKEYSALSELYSKEKVTQDSPETIGKDVANKIIDTLAFTYMITIKASVYTHTLEYQFLDCNKNESSSCVDSVFQKFESATPEIIENIKFDDSYLDSCRNYFQGADQEGQIGMLKTQLSGLFEEVGYSGNVDDYISYETICARFRTVHSSAYEGILDDVSEPIQRYVIALTFFGLTGFYENRESLTGSVEQIVG